MFPDWPQSPSDLVPLPLCDGPKLAAFDFKGPRQIEFLDLLGEGIHGCVFKVRIHETSYALKVFLFLDERWIDTDEETWNDDDAIAAMYHYQDPFNCECRAYGRLQESGHTELSVQCFGYVLLDEKHEEVLHRWFADVHGDDESDNWARKRFLSADGRQPPWRCLVKELGQAAGTEIYRLTPINRLKRNVRQLQQLGIIDLDLNASQVVNGKIGDFSTAVTMPHFRTNPELNPHLTPQQALAIEYETFVLSISDYWALDEIVMGWNQHSHSNPKTRFGPTAYTFPGGKGLQGVKSLRNKPHRSRIFTFVDPRRHVDRQKAASKRKLARWRLDEQPSKWHYERDDDAPKPLIAETCPTWTLGWAYKDGHLFPKKIGKDRNPFL